MRAHHASKVFVFDKARPTPGLSFPGCRVLLSSSMMIEPTNHDLSHLTPIGAVFSLELPRARKNNRVHPKGEMKAAASVQHRWSRSLSLSLSRFVCITLLGALCVLFSFSCHCLSLSLAGLYEMFLNSLVALLHTEDWECFIRALFFLTKVRLVRAALRGTKVFQSLF